MRWLEKGKERKEEKLNSLGHAYVSVHHLRMSMNKVKNALSEDHDLSQKQSNLLVNQVIEA